MKAAARKHSADPAQNHPAFAPGSSSGKAGISDARAMLGVDLDIGLSAMASHRNFDNRNPRLAAKHNAGGHVESLNSGTTRSAQNVPPGINKAAQRILPLSRTNNASNSGAVSGAGGSRPGLIGRLGL